MNNNKVCLYSVAGVASHYKTGLSVTLAAPVVARSQEEALGAVARRMQQEWPTNEGWQHDPPVVALIEQEFVERVYPQVAQTNTISLLITGCALGAFATLVIVIGGLIF